MFDTLIPCGSQREAGEQGRCFRLRPTNCDRVHTCRRLAGSAGLVLIHRRALIKFNGRVLERHRFGSNQVLARRLDEASELAPRVNFGVGSPDIQRRRAASLEPHRHHPGRARARDVGVDPVTQIPYVLRLQSHLPSRRLKEVPVGLSQTDNTRRFFFPSLQSSARARPARKVATRIGVEVRLFKQVDRPTVVFVVLVQWFFFENDSKPRRSDPVAIRSCLPYWARRRHYATPTFRLALTNRNSTRLFSAVAIRLSIASECPS